MNLSVDIRYSIVAFFMSLLTVNVELGLPYRNVWINWSLPWDKVCSLLFLILFKRICRGVWKLGQWRKNPVVVLVLLPQSHNGFKVSWKQFPNLWLKSWLRPRCNLVRSLVPCGLIPWILKYYLHKVIKFSRFFLKIETSWVSNFPIEIVPLTYSRRKEWILETIVSWQSFLNQHLHLIYEFQPDWQSPDWK